MLITARSVLLLLVLGFSQAVFTKDSFHDPPPATLEDHDVSAAVIANLRAQKFPPDDSHAPQTGGHAINHTEYFNPRDSSHLVKKWDILRPPPVPRPPRDTNVPSTRDFQTFPTDPDARLRSFAMASLNGVDYGPLNYYDNRGYTVASSRMWTLENLPYSFRTAAGPSWGCTSIFVYSDLGVWMAHFWEGTYFVADRGQLFMQKFIRQGMGENGHPSLPRAAMDFFGRDALFVNVAIFTPSVGNGQRRVTETETRTPAAGPGGMRLDRDDPWWHREIEDTKATILRIIPRAQFQIMTYPLLIDMRNVVRDNPEPGLAVFDYVPERRMQYRGYCYIMRSIRISWPSSAGRPSFTVTWPAGRVPLGPDVVCPHTHQGLLQTDTIIGELR